MVRLTALVCVHNEEAQLSHCLRSLSFCDEIVVVADRCTDRSAEVARRHGAVVVSGIFPHESQRRAAGLDAAHGNWILEVEADEQVSSALAWEIRHSLQMKPAGDWFDVPVRNLIGETEVIRGWTLPLGEACGPRLYRPGAKQWEPGRSPVSRVVGAQAGVLNGALTRTVASDTAGLLQRLQRLAVLSGEDLADGGVVGSLAAVSAQGAGRFLSAYVAAGAWREGRHGLLVALAAGSLPLLAHFIARDLLEERARAEAEARRPEVVGLHGR